MSPWQKLLFLELLTFGLPTTFTPMTTWKSTRSQRGTKTLAMAPTTASTNDGQIQTILPAALASALVKLLGVYISWQIVIKIACSWTSEKRTWSWKKVEVIFQRKRVVVFMCGLLEQSLYYFSFRRNTKQAEVFGKSWLLMLHDKHSAPETKKTK